jgi:hypothetical protein
VSSPSSIKKNSLSDISVKKTYEYVQNIAPIEQKLASSPEKVKFVGYISKILENNSADYVVHEFPGYVNHLKSSEVRVTDRGALRTIKGRTLSLTNCWGLRISNENPKLY